MGTVVNEVMGTVADRGTKERALELATGCLRELGERGWCTEDLERFDGCLLGATWYANDPEDVECEIDDIYDHWGREVWLEVNSKFGYSSGVYRFNDSIRSTKESMGSSYRGSAKDVKAMLRRAIKRLTKELAAG